MHLRQLIFVDPYRIKDNVPLFFVEGMMRYAYGWLQSKALMRSPNAMNRWKLTGF